MPLRTVFPYRLESLKMKLKIEKAWNLQKNASNHDIFKILQMQHRGRLWYLKTLDINQEN